MAPILLAGAYGQHNPGDDALLTAFLDALGTDDLVVTSQEPVTIEHLHGVTSMAPTAKNVADWLRHGRHLVVGGGTVFKTLHPSSGRRPNSLLVRTLALVRAARARGITVSFVGVGAGRLSTPRASRIARTIALHTDLLVLRDDESASVLAAAGVPTPLRVGADPAWTLFDTPAADLDPRRRVDGRARDGSLLVALSHHAGGPGLAGHLADGLARTSSLSRVDLQPWQADGAGLDHLLAHEVESRLRDQRPDLLISVVEAPADLHQAAAQSSRYDLVLGLRFHALVASASTGTPFVAIAHEPKLAGVARRFGQLWVPPQASAPVLGHAIDRGAERVAPDRATASLEAARAAEAFRLLRMVLTGHAADTGEPSRARLALSSGGGAW
jgi:polysaccharide pyruvyl transferase WcaK-like protein